MKDLQAAAAILLLSQRVHVANAIDNINSEFGEAVPCSTTRCAIALTDFFATSFRAGVRKLYAQVMQAEFSKALAPQCAHVCGQNLRAVVFLQARAHVQVGGGHRYIQRVNPRQL